MLKYHILCFCKTFPCLLYNFMQEQQQQVHVFGIGFYVGAIIITKFCSCAPATFNRKNKPFSHTFQMKRRVSTKKTTYNLITILTMDNNLQQVHHIQCTFDLTIISFVRIVWNATKTLMRVQHEKNHALLVWKKILRWNLHLNFSVRFGLIACISLVTLKCFVFTMNMNTTTK